MKKKAPAAMWTPKEGFQKLRGAFWDEKKAPVAMWTPKEGF